MAHIRRCSLAMMILLAMTGVCLAQTSPEVHDDRRVTFRLRASGAQKVAVRGEFGGGENAMTRGEDNIWTTTIGPLEPDIYGYSFVVDGLATIDPMNPHVKPMRQPRTSMLEVTGQTPQPWTITDVPRGTLHAHHYISAALDGKERRVHVYTPPGYERSGDERYPVLYLLHGSGDNDACWSAFGRAGTIADNLIAAGKAQPMIIVMPDGHAVPRPEGRPTDEQRDAAARAFEADLLKDVVPLIESSYRVLEGSRHRAIAGLSMGGGQALTVGLCHPNRFDWIGAFSSAPPGNEVIAAAFVKPEEVNATLRLLWIACGKDDFLLERNQQFIERLKSAGIQHEYVQTEGGHQWTVWRRYLAELLPRLFSE